MGDDVERGVTDDSQISAWETGVHSIPRTEGTRSNNKFEEENAERWL